MQTRLAARNLRELAADVGSNAPPATHLVAQPASIIKDGNNTDLDTKPLRGQKRKRSTTASTKQPMKGGWEVLPHGVGGLPPAPMSSDDAHVSKSVIPGAKPASKFARTASARSTRNDKSRRQTHLTLRVTKATTSQSSEQKVSATNKREVTTQAENNLHVEDNGTLEGETQQQVVIEQKRDKRRRTTASTGIISTKEASISAPQEEAVVEKKATDAGFKDEEAKRVASEEQSSAAAKTDDGLDPDFKAKIKRGVSNPYGLTPGYSPYPHRSVPSSEACEEVYRILAELHGEVTQPQKVPAPSLEIAGCGEVPSVLDALLRTLISGNTMMARANEAIRGLVKKYGVLQEGVGAGSVDWNKVRLSPPEDLVLALKPAGCAQIKGRQIMAILGMVHEENLARVGAYEQGKKTEATGRKTEGPEFENQGQEELEIEKAAQGILSLDHFHNYTKEEAMTKFLKYPGIGVKTAACVILFCLRIPCFAVDTHVHKFCQWLGWVPAKATELDSFNHGEFKVPDHLKYGLHQLFIRHGQQCFKCRKATKPGTGEWDEAADCPLEHLLDRSKGGAKGLDSLSEET